MNALRILSVALFLLLAGCVVARGVFHPVKEGETLWRICRTYGVDLQEVAEMNNIKDPTELRAGKKIFIPGARRLRKVVPYNRLKDPVREKEVRIIVDRGRFSWPVKGRLSTSFGINSGTRHDGIDIKAPAGTPIRAASDGSVVYSDIGMRGYGNIVIIKHRDNFYTVYARNEKNLVKVGDEVRRGDIIGRVGNTGPSSGFHLHFEVRHGKKVRNPLFFLP